MVAGMVMPLADLRAIYELLFRDGVIVAKKDKHPQSMHPDLQGMSNLKVIHVMTSLKSKGCVRETFVWKHAYYYITNEGVAYLRNYLHLPPEILPASLQRVSRPASSARVRTTKGRTPYTPKPKYGQESQEAMMERRIYRHRSAETGRQSDRPPSTFRASESVCQPGVQTPTFFRRDKNVCRGYKTLAKQDDQKSSVNDVQLPMSLVPSSSTVDDSSKEIPTVQTALCASVKGVRQEGAKKTAVNPTTALKKSECGTIKKASIAVPKEEFLPDEGSKLALEVASEVGPGGQQTVPLLAGLVEKEEQDVKAEEWVPEDVEVVSEDSPEFYDAEMMKQLNLGVKDTTITVKAISKTQTSETPYSGAFGCGGSVVPQEGPTAALKTTPVQEDQINPAEDPEKGQGVQRAWHDVLEGLSSSSSSSLLSAVKAVWALLWTLGS